MGKFKLNKAGIEKIRGVLQHQVRQTTVKMACEAYDFFTNFAYKKSGGGPTEGGGGYTLYYLANWNVSINSIDASVSPEFRLIGDGETVNQYSVDREKAKWITDAAAYGDNITVTNSVWYGTVLNNGGSFGDVYGDGKEHEEDDRCEPNRFIELCIDHMEQNAGQIIRQVAEECPSI